MLEKETQIETKGGEQNLYQIMMQMCLCIHILLMGFFACMQIWFMVTVNILSVLLYCFGVARIKTTKKISQWLLAIFSEILIHCVSLISSSSEERTEQSAVIWSPEAK